MKKLSTLLLIPAAFLFAEEEDEGEFCITKESDHVRISISTKDKEPNCCYDFCYDPCCDTWGFFVEGSYLYWYAKENNLPIAAQVRTDLFANSGQFPFFVTNPTKNHIMPSSWDSGFRIGVGWESFCSRWTTAINWTSLRNSSKKKLSLSEIPSVFSLNFQEGVEGFFSPWIYDPINKFALGSGESPLQFTLPFTKIEATWKLDYDMIDLLWEREWQFTRCFSFQPFFGLRGGFVDISYGLDQSIFQQDLPTFLFKTRFHNCFSGIGLNGGLHSTWAFSCLFSLYGKLGVSLLWGKSEEKRKEVQELLSLNVAPVITAQNHYGMQAALDLGIGLRYSQDFCCQRYLLEIDTGWEHQYWPQLVTRIQIVSPFTNFDENLPSFSTQFQKLDQNITDLVLGGLTVRAKFSF